ncbi:MAG: SGNH/GDSL hydrolase family protein [Phototrophicaceae bacterium]
MQPIYVIIPTLLLGVLIYIIGRSLSRFSQSFRQPQNNPQAFFEEIQKQPTHKKVVVCVGDSITHGVISANYVEQLRARYITQGYEFVNAGINGDLAWNVAQRLDKVIACRPNYVTLLIGTNDVNATYSDKVEAVYREGQKIPQTPDLAWYRHNVEQILDRLQTETQASIAVLQIPLLGEDLSSEMNRLVDQYNATLQEITEARHLPLLPLNVQMKAHLPHAHTPPAYTADFSLMYGALLKHEVLRQSWDAISKANRLALLTDHIHLNDRAAILIVEMVDEFLKPSRS